MGYNKIILIGNCVRDIELRYTSGGVAIVKTSIATSRRFTSNGEKKEETCFIDITFFGRSAEIANQHLLKGSKILVEGRLHFAQWTDQNGGKRSKHSVTVENMQMLDSRSGTNNDGGNGSHGGYDAQVKQDYQQKRQMPENTTPEIDMDSEEPPPSKNIAPNRRRYPLKPHAQSSQNIFQKTIDIS
jgi:single-strand DNA-binding protein